MVTSQRFVDLMARFIDVNGGLPRYGAIDATWLVSLFYPLLLGAVIGDIGYGLVLLAVATLAIPSWRRIPHAKTVAALLTRTAVVSIVFGLAYVEFFGDVGTNLLRYSSFTVHPLLSRGWVVALVVLGLLAVLVQLAAGLLSAAVLHRQRGRDAWRRFAADAIILMGLPLAWAAVGLAIGIVVNWLQQSIASVGNVVLGALVGVVVSVAYAIVFYALSVNLQVMIVDRIMGERERRDIDAANNGAQ